MGKFFPKNKIGEFEGKMVNGLVERLTKPCIVKGVGETIDWLVEFNAK
jgi:hypothetical protein